jgi:outer membrane receptor protein involved in Fe transport
MCPLSTRLVIMATMSLLGCAGASAQAQPDAGGTVTITGSRIARPDAEGISPMLTLNREDIRLAAPTSLGDLLQKLPNVGASLNSNGTQGTAFGASTINLRYLGSAEGSGNRTLVLVDGHRWINAAGGRGFRDFVDLNTIPLGIVDRIEVLKDGASAIYGADAIAGVVNIHTKRRRDGVEAQLRVGQSAHGDNRHASGYLNWGYRSGGKAVFVSANLHDSQPILTADRALTRTALTPLLAAPASPRGLYVLPGLADNSYFATPPGFAQSGASAITRNQGVGVIAVGAAAAGDFHVARLPDDYYNTQTQGLYAIGPSRQGALFVRGSFQPGDTDVTVEALHARRSSSQLFAPVPLDLRGANGFSLAASQAHNPFGSANGVPLAHALGFSGPAFRIQRVPTELGNRRNRQQVDTDRLLFAAEGMAHWLGEWRWDASYSYSRNRASFDAINQVNLDHVYRALSSPASCAADSACVPLDIFGPITPAMSSYIRYNAHDENGTSQADLTLNAARSLGTTGLALGIEYRREAAFDQPDAFAASASTVLPLLAGVAQSPTSAQSRDLTRGSYRLHEAYMELNTALLDKLSVDAALRYSHYSTVGGKATGKLGILFKPVKGWVMRATRSQGFRAPSILELYQGQRQTSFPALDPCNGGGGGLTGCAGVPHTYHQSQYNNGLIAGVTAGNPALKPDSADMANLGIAYSVRSATRGLSVTADKFQVKVSDAIAAHSASLILQSCARSGVFCELVQRNPSGEVTRLTQAVVNLSRIEVDGIDASLRYHLPFARGRLEGVVDLAYLQRYRLSVPQPDGSTMVDDRAGKSDQPRASFPRLKGQASLRYQVERFKLGWKARYIGGSADLPNNPVNGGRLAGIWYQDMLAEWTFPGQRLRLAIGIDNLFDRQPPASAANNPINFDIYTYDIRGRSLHARLILGR